MKLAIIEKWNPQIHGETPIQEFIPNDKYLFIDEVPIADFFSNKFKDYMNDNSRIALVTLYTIEEYSLAKISNTLRKFQTNWLKMKKLRLLI